MERITADYRTVFEKIPGSHVLLQPDSPVFTILDVSNEYLKATGRTREDLISKGLFEAFPNNPANPRLTSENTVRASLEYALHRKEVHHMPVQRYDIRPGNGVFEERYWEALIKPVLDDNGEVRYLMYSAEDVTEKIKAQQTDATLRSIGLAYGLFMKAPVIIAILRGKDNVLEMANEAAYKLWGKSNEIIGKPLVDVLPQLKGQGILEVLEHVRLTGRQHLSKEIPVTIQKDGNQENYFLDVFCQPYFEQDNSVATGVFVVLHNVTEQVQSRMRLQKSEENYRGLFESMDQGFCIIELMFDEKQKVVDYRHVEVNPAFEKQSGLKDVVGKSIRELVPEIEEEWFEIYGNVVSTGGPVRFVTQSKALSRWFEVYADRMTNGEGSKLGVFFTDISEQRYLQEKQRKAEARQSFLLNLTEHLRPLTDPKKIQHEAASLIGAYLKANRIGFAEDQGDAVQITSNYCTEGIETIEGLHNYEDYGEQLLADLQAGRIILHNDIAADPTLSGPEKEAHRKMQLEATINIPLLKNGRLVAVLFVHWERHHEWTAEDLAFFRQVADRTWVAVQRARADNALRESEGRLKKTISVETVGVIYSDFEGVIHDANLAFEKMSGYTREEIVSGKLRWKELSTHEFIEATLKAREEFLTKGENTPYEKQNTRPDGSRWWGLFSGKRLSENECVEFVIDISERKHAEETIRQSKERFELLAKATQDVVWDWNLLTDEIWWNEAFKTVFGYRQEDIEPTVNSWYSRLHPDDKDRVTNDIHSVIYNGGKNWAAEYRFRRNDGSYANVFDRGYALHDSNGKPYRMLGSMQDITDRKQYEQALIEKDRNFRSMIHEAPVAMLVCKGKDLVLEIINQKMLQILNKSDEIIGKPLLEAVPELQGQEVVDILRNVLHTGEPFYGKEVRIPLYRDGQLEDCYFNFTYTPVTENGKIVGVLDILTDVTEQVKARRKIEESHREIKFALDLMPTMVWQTLPDGNAYSFNQVFLHYSGRSLQELNGNQWMELLHPDDIDKTRYTWQQALAAGHIYEIEHRLRSKAASYRWFITRAVPLKDKNGSILKWYGTSTDIQDQKEVAEELERRVADRTRELEIRNKELEQFTYVSHHDLQEPLRKIIMFTDMVRNDANSKLTEEAGKKLQRVISAARRMSDALHDVLNFASLSKEEHFREVDLNYILELVQFDLELLINEKHAKIQLDELPTIHAVPQQMQQLFYNLLNNALKFADSNKPPTIKITWTSLSSAEISKHAELNPSLSYYQITVHDNGIGFSADASEKIFGMFQRLHSKEAFSGTGIGLALCRKVITNHYGKIWAESTPGVGSKFIMLLPA